MSDADMDFKINSIFETRVRAAWRSSSFCCNLRVSPPTEHFEVSTDSDMVPTDDDNVAVSAGMLILEGQGNVVVHRADDGVEAAGAAAAAASVAPVASVASVATVGVMPTIVQYELPLR